MEKEYTCTRCSRVKLSEDIELFNPCICKVCAQEPPTVDEVLDVIHREISGYTPLHDINMINVHLVAEYLVKKTAFASMLHRELDWQLYGMPKERS